MRTVLQRVNSASVWIERQQHASIGRGLLLLIGFANEDQPAQLTCLAEKILNQRIFADFEGRFQHSVLDSRGELLLVPQFTLLADLSRGRRPDFHSALRPEAAAPLFELFVAQFRRSGLKTECGVFGADMQVRLENDGPVTLVLEG